MSVQKHQHFGSVDRASLVDSPYIAQIHRKCIPQGFLSLLGTQLLTKLYSFLSEKEVSLVARNDNGKIIGFLCASFHPSGLLKRFLICRPSAWPLLCLIIIRNPRLLRGLLESAKASSKKTTLDPDNSAGERTEVELLSIAVSECAQQRGVGSLLLQSFEEHLKSCRVARYRLIAGQNLVSANRFYKKNGFRVCGCVEIHRGEKSTIYTKDISR